MNDKAGDERSGAGVDPQNRQNDAGENDFRANADVPSVVHELNNQLAVIDGNLHLAKKWAGSEDRIIRVLSEAEAASEEIKGLLTQFRSAAMDGRKPKGR